MVLLPLCIWRAQPKGAWAAFDFSAGTFEAVCGGAESGRVLCCLWVAFVQLFPFLFAIVVSLWRLSATHEACCSSASVAVPKMCFTHTMRDTKEHCVYWYL